MAPPVDERLGLHHRRIEDEVLEDAKDLVRPGRPRHQPVGVGKRRGHRLLQRDVLAGIHRRQRRFAVEMVREQDIDGIDARVVEERAVVRVDRGVRKAPGAAARGRLSGVDIGDGDDFRVGVVPVFQRVKVRDAPRADEPHTNPVKRRRHQAIPPFVLRASYMRPRPARYGFPIVT